MLSANIFLLTVLISGSHQQCFSNNDNTSRKYEEERYNTWIDSRNDFSVSLFRLLNERNKERNIIFSPSTVHDLLLLVYFGAAQETEAALAKVLRKPDDMEKSEIWRFYQTEREVYYGHETKKYPLKVANKIFFSNTLKLRQCIRDNLRNETEVIDFQNEEWAKHYINNWVANVTEGEITRGVEDLSSISSAAFVCAVYFKEKWRIKFNPTDTHDLSFEMSTKKTKMTKMMTVRADFSIGYVREIKARVLKMPYDGEKQSMYILLPYNDLDSMMESMDSNVIKLITSPDFLDYPSPVDVVVPKYKARSEILLTSVLQELGLGTVVMHRADLSRFTGKADVFVKEVHHEAVIKVDEEGTTAAAVTTVNVNVMTHPAPLDPIVTFICDHPFAYFIYDNTARKILFMGTFRDPETGY